MAGGGARSGSGRKVVPIEVKKAKGTYRKERDKKTVPPSGAASNAEFIIDDALIPLYAMIPVKPFLA